jgi:hypothetical protein
MASAKPVRVIPASIDEIFLGEGDNREPYDVFYFRQPSAHDSYTPKNDFQFETRCFPDKVSCPQFSIRFCYMDIVLNDDGEETNEKVHAFAELDRDAFFKIARDFKRLYPHQGIIIGLSQEGLRISPEENDDANFQKYLSDIKKKDEKSPPVIPGATTEEQMAANFRFYDKMFQWPPAQRQMKIGH